ncbi:hypothetical protein HDU96_002216 [Phlyctochytrium bullatum]|nr:hypothetical protein HDU96_002216 [Phlyctochytrium bullatum]
MTAECELEEYEDDAADDHDAEEGSQIAPVEGEPSHARNSSAGQKIERKKVYVYPPSMEDVGSTGDIGANFLSLGIDANARTKTLGLIAVLEERPMASTLKDMDVGSDYDDDPKDDIGQSLLVRKRGVFKIPFFALMFSYVTASVLLVGVIGWKFTLDAASSKLDDLALEVQEQAAHEVSAFIWDQATMLSQVTQYQREMFLKNEWSVSSPEKRDATLNSMLLVVNQFRSWTVDTFFHIYPEGPLFGFFYPDKNSTVLHKWQQEGTVLQTMAYMEGRWSQVDTINDPGTGYDHPGTNGTLLYEGTHGVNWSDFTTCKISTVYEWYGELYKTSLSVTQNPVSREVVLVGNDWTLGFLGRKINESLAQIGYTMFMAAVEPSTGRIIATSNSSIKLSIGESPNVRVRMYNETDNSFLFDFSRWLNESDFSTSVAGGGNERIGDHRLLISHLNRTGVPLLTTRLLNNINFSLRIGLISVPFDANRFWLAIQYMDLDAVAAPLRQASKLTEVSIFTIMGGVVIISTVFAFTVARQIEIVVRQILTLKDLRFQEVLNREKGVKVTSFVSELADLQNSFFAMVLSFAEKLRTKKSAVM